MEEADNTSLGLPPQKSPTSRKAFELGSRSRVQRVDKVDLLVESFASYQLTTVFNLVQLLVQWRVILNHESISLWMSIEFLSTRLPFLLKRN